MRPSWLQHGRGGGASIPSITSPNGLGRFSSWHGGRDDRVARSIRAWARTAQRSCVHVPSQLLYFPRRESLGAQTAEFGSSGTPPWEGLG